MGNPFSTQQGASSAMSGIGSGLAVPTPLDTNNLQGGAGAGGGPGLMSIYQQLMQGQNKGPGLYTAPMDKEAATAPEQARQMNDMQPPAWNPSWGQPGQ